MLAQSDGPVISFAMGSPAADVLPVEAIASLTRDLLQGAARHTALEYTPTEGDPGLRIALLGRLADRGLQVDPSNLLITAGGMQGLDLVARLFVEPGTLVAVERPGYANGLATFLNHGARLLQIPIDQGGIVIEALQSAAAAGDVPRLIYTTPAFQNPSGVTTSLARRVELLNFARSIGALVLEDDPYSELKFESTTTPSLLDLDEGAGWVVQVRTFSKIVSPGLRVGWVIAPSDVVVRMIQAKQSMDTCASSLGQGIIRQLILENRLDDHVRWLCGQYPERRDSMIRELDSLGPLGASWTRPAGGMFIWLNLPSWMSGEAVAARSFAEGVAVVPGSAFTLEKDEPAIRLCFAAVSPDAIVPGISALRTVLMRMADERESWR